MFGRILSKHSAKVGGDISVFGLLYNTVEQVPWNLRSGQSRKRTLICRKPMIKPILAVRLWSSTSSSISTMYHNIASVGPKVNTSENYPMKKGNREVMSAAFRNKLNGFSQLRARHIPFSISAPHLSLYTVAQLHGYHSSRDFIRGQKTSCFVILPSGCYSQIRDFWLISGTARLPL